MFKKSLCGSVGLMLVAALLSGRAQAASQPYVGFVVKSLSDQHWELVRAGAKKAAADMGVKLEFLGPAAETEVTQQIAMMEDLLTKKIDVLAVAPSQPATAIEVFKKADAQGVPVLLIDTDAAFDKKASFIGTGNFAAAKLGGEYFSKTLPAGSNVVVIRGALGDLTHDQRTDGFVAGIDKSKIHVLDIQPADSALDKALAVMENLLQKNKGKINAVFTTADLMALGALQAVQQAGLQDKIKILGFDGTKDAIAKIKADEMVGSIAQNPYGMGYKAIESAVRLLKKQPVDKRIDTGAFLITKANYAEAEKTLKERLSN